jgi:tetratricopeptide (TPR) repeat protein
MKKKNKASSIKSIAINHNGKVINVTELEATSWLKGLAPNLALQQAKDLHNKYPRAEKIQEFYYHLLLGHGLHNDVIQAASSILAKQPRNKTALFWKAHIFRLSGRENEAKDLLEKIIKHSPADIRVLNTLGSLYKDLGNFNQANDILTRVNRIDPTYGKAYWNRSDITSDIDNEIKNIEKTLASNSIASSDLHFLHFSAYRLYEKKGQHKQAFEHLMKGNAHKRKLLNYTVDNDLKMDISIANFFNADYFKDKNNSASNHYAPIFIVGFPRSGTTLIEQVLASHSQVSGGDELPAMAEATIYTQHQQQLAGHFPDWLSAISSTGLNTLAETYWNKTAAIRGDKQTHTDKNLLNYKSIGLIAKVFPNAKIIALKREPLDVCFGCYRQLFATDNMPFCYDFKDLAKSYSSYLKLMDHWQDVLPGFIKTINYENFISDTNNQIDELLAFCELKKEQPCYEFYKTQRTVKTLSSAQVRQPIFNNGVQRWKKYEQNLSGLIDALSTENIDVIITPTLDKKGRIMRPLTNLLPNIKN